MTDDIELTEARMRRALGLDSSTALPLDTMGRTSAVQPGIPPGAKPPFSGQGPDRPGSAPSRSESPSPLRQRLAALERQLAEERAHHDQSRHQLEGAQRVLAELQARVQRTALDHADELAAERAATVWAQRELHDLLFERDRLAQEALPATVSAILKPEPVTPVPQPSTSPVAADASARPSHGRPRLHAAPEPKPVRWWTASYRVGSKNKR